MKNYIKHLLCLLMILLAGQQMKAVDWFPVREVNSKFSFSIGGGAVLYSGANSAAVGLSGTMWGAHLRIMGLWPAHSSDASVEKQDDKSCFAVHAGYQIPITKAIRIIPLIGYSRVSLGYTDGSNYTINNGIHNHFETTDKTDGLDYGGSLVFNHKMLVITASYTTHTAFGSIGVEF
jgi:hypothetical protein